MAADVETVERKAPGARAEGARHRRLRMLLLGLLAFSIAGTVVELILLEHLEDLNQQLPMYSMAVGVLAGVVMLVRPTRLTVNAFRLTMLGVMVVGIVGVWLHYRGNVEFELEMYPALQGWELFWNAMEGATPTLAPGLMVQLGLLGLAGTHAHPALGRGRGGRTLEEDA